MAKIWTKIGMIILIVACLFNITIKLVNKLSFDTEMISSAQYIQDQINEENKENNKKSEKN